MNRKDKKLIFFGTPDFSARTLQALVDAQYNIIVVVTRRSKPQGRNTSVLEDTPVKKTAHKNNLFIIEESKSADLFEQLKKFLPDAGILFAYGKIIPKKILDIFPLGIINIHPSLLPLYRGPSPVQTALLDNAKESGVTLMLLDYQMDHGPILAQKKIDINKDETADILHERLAQEGTQLLLDNLDRYLFSEISLQPQKHLEATYTKILKREDGLVDWDKNRDKIYAQFRGLYPWPGIFTYLETKRFKLGQISPLQTSQNGQIGLIFKDNDGFPAVVCRDGAIRIERLQVEGKGEVSARDFLQGHRDFVGSIFGSK